MAMQTTVCCRNLLARAQAQAPVPKNLGVARLPKAQMLQGPAVFSLLSLLGNLTFRECRVRR